MCIQARRRKGGNVVVGWGGVTDAQAFFFFFFFFNPHSDQATPRNSVNVRQQSLGKVVPPWLTAALRWGGEDACRRLAVTLLALA